MTSLVVSQSGCGKVVGIHLPERASEKPEIPFPRISCKHRSPSQPQKPKDEGVKASGKERLEP